MTFRMDHLKGIRRFQARAVITLTGTLGMERLANRKLENPGESPMLTSMNAVEVIEEIKRLPEKERSKVIEFVRHLPNTETVEAINEPLEGLPRFDSVEELFKELKD